LADDKVRMSARQSRSLSPKAESRPRPAEQARWDLEELPVVVDPEAALGPDSEIVHDQFQTNLIGQFSVAEATSTAPWPARRTGCAAAFITTATPPCRWSARRRQHVRSA